MMKMLENGEFIETAEFSGNMYGTSKKAIMVCLLLSLNFKFPA